MSQKQLPDLYSYQKKDLSKWWKKLGKRGILGWDMGLGKGQPYGSKVLVKDGWKKIEELKEGDKVYGSDGKLHNVTGVYPKGKINTYRFHYADGTSLVFCACSSSNRHIPLSTM